MTLDTSISLHKLEVFCLVAELASVSKAADRLYVAQPVVSAHLKSLEQRVGAKLLERRDNRMVPTEAGEATYRWACDVLTRSREMDRELQGIAGGTRGAATIASSMTVGSYLLPDILSAFRRNHPEAHITLHNSDPEHAAASAEAGDCDFAVLIAEEDQVASRNLRFEWLTDEPLVLIAAAGSLPESNALSAHELARLPYVTSSSQFSRQRMIDRKLGEIGLSSLEVVIELGHAESMKRAVRAGLGVAFMFRSSVTEEIERGELREIEIIDACLRAPVLLVHRVDKRFTAMQQSLMGLVRESMNGRMATPTSE